jgi:meso-butanediol dehydrogenase/(S,S)-butanediol dehydrogenase/diacetyl reductase
MGNEIAHHTQERAQLDGKIAIVTGAASGIGRETALVFARRGARVLAVDLNQEGLDALVAEGDQQGLQIRSFAQNLTAEHAASEVFAYCRANIGEADVLANIAGQANDRSAHETSDDDLDRFYELNLKVTFRMSREAVRQMTEGGGSIVNTTSAVALVGMRGTAPYSAAKAAIVGLTRQMAADYGDRNIRVNAVAPGLIRTPATDARIAANAFDNTVTKARPLQRVGTPLDIANAFAFLASDEASFVTGAVLPVCGGWSTTRFRAP